MNHNYKIIKLKDKYSGPISMEEKENIPAIKGCKTFNVPAFATKSVERLNSGPKKYQNGIYPGITFVSSDGILQFCTIILEAKWAIDHEKLTLLDISYKNVKQAKISAYPVCTVDNHL